MRRELLATGAAAAAIVGLAWVIRRPARCEVTVGLDAFKGPVEPYASFEPVTSCDPTEKAGVDAFRDWVLTGAGGTDQGIVRSCDIGGPSHHHEGRAWDWGVPSKKIGDAFTQCLTVPGPDGEPDALARRAGIRYIIWPRRILIADGQGWREYNKPGGDPHTTHAHFSFGWDGASAKTSLYSAIADGAAVSDVALSIEGAPDPGSAEHGHQIPAVRTPLTREELADVLSNAHKQVLGSTPSYNRLGMAWAMVNHETGNTKSAWHHNWGNIIKTSGWNGDWHALNVSAGEPALYRSYKTPHDGAVGFWSLLATRYPAALEQFSTGDAAASAAALKAGGWFQAPVQLYSKALANHFKVWRSNFEPDALTELGLVVLLALALGGTAIATERG